MNKGFTTKLIENEEGNKVIVYGINKVYCNGCTKQVQHLQTVFACRHPMTYTDRPDEEHRDINCAECMAKKDYYCDKLEVNHVHGEHIDVKSKLYICPLDEDLEEYMYKITKS